MENKRLQVDLDELAEAMDQQDNFENDFYLDTQTGKVLLVEEELVRAVEDGESEEEMTEEMPDWEKKELELVKQIVNDDQERFVLVPGNETRENYRLMEHFIGSLGDSPLREKLETAIAGKGAFSRFKNTLLMAPEVRQQWFDYEQQHKREWAREWLETMNIETTWQPPPPSSK